jgi:hypothetical protein
MSADSPIDALKNIVLSRFPWLAYVSVAKDGGLSLRAAAAKLLHLQGDAGDPGVVRAGDLVVRLYLDSATPALYASSSASAPYLWILVAAGVGPPDPSNAGTPIGAAVGSSKVTAA